MSTFVEELQYRFGPLLKPLAWCNARIMETRENLYRRGMIKQWLPPSPTVSVGNIGWGGSGKTPVVDWLLRWAEKQSLQPSVLTRGYRGRPASYPFQVGPGSLVEESGDEPLMLARQHPEAHIVVDPNRSRGGRWLFDHYRPDMVVLDDGFQHMAVHRDFDLVLLKPSDLVQHWNKVIPAGPWREPVSALSRASAFLIKTEPGSFNKVSALAKYRLEALGRPVFLFGIEPVGFRQVITGEAAPDFGGEPYLLVSGVGEPKQVHRTAKRYLGYRAVDHLAFPDHHAFTKADVVEILAAMRRKGAKGVLCTPKDAVKLGPMCTEEFYTFDLRIGFGPSLTEHGATFPVWWDEQWQSIRRSGREQADGETSPRTEEESHSGTE